MIKHSELVRQLAEGMAKEDIPLLFDDKFICKKEFDFQRDLLIKSHIRSANMAIKFGAKMFEQSFMKGFEHALKFSDENGQFFGDWRKELESDLKEQMIEIGLIPDQLPDAGKEIEKEVGDE